MTRRAWVYRGGKLREIDLNAPRPEPKGPYIWKDTLTKPIKCDGDGHTYYDMSSYRTAVKMLEAKGIVALQHGEELKLPPDTLEAEIEADLLDTKALLDAGKPVPGAEPNDEALFEGELDLCKITRETIS